MRDTLIRLSEEMNIHLTDKQLTQFETYARLLVEWNEKMNLTGITEGTEIAKKHFIDSMVGYEEIKKVIDEKGEASLIDVGTGAGFPGLPLKILIPQLKLTLLDSLQKRIGFLETVCREIGLTDAVCIHGRAEDAAHLENMREKYDFAVARAVAAMPVLMEYCSGYVKVGGKFMAYKGPSLPEELKAAAKAQKVLGLTHVKTMEAEILKRAYEGEDAYEHYVAIFRKVKPLTLQYPRKQSKIKSNPLV